MRRSRDIACCVVSILMVVACGESGAPATTVSSTSTTAPVSGVVVSPEFVQGVIPGAEVTLLVARDDEAAGVATVTASAPGAEVTVRPSQISGTEVAEVTVVPHPVSAETELTVTIEVTSGDRIQSVTGTATVHPWEDDRGEQAAEILGLFTSWLEENRPDLGVSPDTEFDGVFLAPELLVVSHYGFFNEELEIGLSWHVMIAPDDFAEIYLRLRSDLRPALAFRIGSWQTALDTGEYEVSEVAPPGEVVR